MKLTEAFPVSCRASLLLSNAEANGANISIANQRKLFAGLFSILQPSECYLFDNMSLCIIHYWTHLTFHTSNSTRRFPALSSVRLPSGSQFTLSLTHTHPLILLLPPGPSDSCQLTHRRYAQPFRRDRKRRGCIALCKPHPGLVMISYEGSWSKMILSY